MKNQLHRPFGCIQGRLFALLKGRLRRGGAENSKRFSHELTRMNTNRKNQKHEIESHKHKLLLSLLYFSCFISFAFIGVHSR